MADQHTMPKEEAMAVLRRAGYPAEEIEEIASQLPDPIDLDRAGPLLLRYGITMSVLRDRMGGSP
jgi:hypothetical protein